MKASDNPFPSILIDEEVDPAAPAAGHKRMFIDSADHKLKTIDSASAVVDYTPTAAVTEITDIATAEMDDTLVLAPDGAGGVEFRAETGVVGSAAAIAFVIDGGGAEIPDGVAGFVEVPFACTITAGRLLADQSGSIVVDVWLEQYADYPPTDADTITASAPLTITTATKSEDSTLTGWTKTIAAGDILGFNVDSCTTIERVTVSLTVTRT